MFIEGEKSGFNTFNDPLNVVLNALDEITLRTSLRAGKDNATITDAFQTVPYTGYELLTVYRTNKEYMGAAAAVSIASLLAVAATFWGWWELGRGMTLNPLEIAKVFDSPVVKEMEKVESGVQVSQTALKMRIRYGK